ncbi:MAG: hypothetical protein JWO25_2782 [Alphaproteobacteria bacterium]|nr:hypothetical protein [Alphaproteobacteria bacterium]
MATTLSVDPRANEGQVLSEAVSRLAGFWRLTNAEVARTLGISAPSASRLRSGAYRLDRGAKPFELAQLLVRLFRGLDALMGSHDDAAIAWLRTANADLLGRPIDLIQTVQGLVAVSDYVDAFRART